jgi:hypothetical protein
MRSRSNRADGSVQLQEKDMTHEGVSSGRGDCNTLREFPADHSFGNAGSGLAEIEAGGGKLNSWTVDGLAYSDGLRAEEEAFLALPELGEPDQAQPLVSTSAGISD